MNNNPFAAMSLNDKKAVAYDMMGQIQYLQAQVNALHQAIADEQQAQMQQAQPLPFAGKLKDLEFSEPVGEQIAAAAVGA